MRHTPCIVLAALLAAPFAFADPAVLGIPDPTCQTPDEWRTHDYGAPALGAFVFGLDDGNLEECGITFLCPGCPDVPADFDGDYDFALGGAVLAVGSGSNGGLGSVACWGMAGHHPQGGTVLVTDLGVGPITATVASDNDVNGGGCGDGIIEPCGPPFVGLLIPPADMPALILSWPPLVPGCNPLDVAVTATSAGNSVTVTPGAPGDDGTYLVFVSGTVGHVHL